MAEFDVDKANGLLDILLKTKDYPAMLPLQQVAFTELAQMVAEVQEELKAEAEEARAKAEEESAAAKEEEKEDAA